MDSKLPARSVPRSRLPTASVSASSSGKRTATSAQLDGDVEHALDRRKAKVEAFSATMNKSSLERRVAAAEKSKRDIEIEYGKLKLDKDKVDRDRRWFSEREKQLSEERDAEHRAFEAEKKEIIAEMKEARNSLETLQKQFDTLSESHETLERAATKANRISEKAQSQLAITQEENERNHAEMEKYRRLWQEKSAECEALRATTSRSKNLPTANSDSASLEVLRSQLLEKSEESRRLSDANAKLQAEVVVLRERYTSVEVLKEEKRELQHRLRAADTLMDQVGALEAQVESLRREKESWVASSGMGADVPISIRQELANMKLDHANLIGQYNSQSELLKQREAELRQVEQEYSTTSDEISKLKLLVRNTEMKALRSERRSQAAQQEIALLKALVDNYDNQDTSQKETYGDEQKALHISTLENIISELKEANAAVSLELDELGGDSGGVISGVNRGAIREMKSALVETRASNVALLENLKAAENQNTFLLDKVDKIEEELWKLRGDVGTGKHVPPGKRVLELVDNPASRWFGKREEDVERLRKENEVLRSLVGDGASAAQVELNGNDEHLVPKETLDVLVQEKGELEKLIKEKEKRLLRLQQIFSSKAEEFRATVTSLLGWKFRFQQNGQVQLTSIYDPNAVLVFSPPPKTVRSGGPGPLTHDDGVKVQLIHTAEEAPPEVLELYRTWVGKWGCVPGFLGSLTVQLYEASPEGSALLKGGA